MSIGLRLPDEVTQYSIFPYAEFSSNVANRGKRIVSLGNNCVLGGVSSFLTEYDSIENILTVNPGKCIIGDVLVETENDIEVSLLDDNNFLNGNNIYQEDGLYYLCITYSYAKSRPHPRASFVLINPSQRSVYVANTSTLIIKIFSVESGIITDSYDQDPDYPENLRQTPQITSQFYNELPTFDPESDIGRFICVTDKSRFEAYFYIGLLTTWGRINLRTDLGGTIDIVLENHEPTEVDWDYNKGTIWHYLDPVNPAYSRLYMLVDDSENSAAWRNIALTEINTINPNINLHRGSGNNSFWLNKISGELFSYVLSDNLDLASTNGEITSWTKIKRTLLVDLTFYLDPTSGNDNNSIPIETSPFQTMSRMMEYLDSFSIGKGVTVTIKIVSGSHIVTESWEIVHPDGNQIQVIGDNVVEKEITSVQNFGETSVKIFFDSLTINEVAIGDYILIYDVDFPDMEDIGIFPEYAKRTYSLPGCYEITGVDSINNSVTITWDVPIDKGNILIDVPHGAITGDCVFIKTIITSHCSFLQINKNNKLMALKNLVLIGRDVANEYGIQIPSIIEPSDYLIQDVTKSSGGVLSYIENIGIRNFGMGFYTNQNSFVRGKNIAVHNCSIGLNLESGYFINLISAGCTGEAGIQIEKGFVEINNCFINGCSSMGMNVTNGASVYAKRTISANNKWGINVENGSNFISFISGETGNRYETCHAINNEMNGFNCINNSVVSCTLSSAFHNGEAGFSASHGSSMNIPMAHSFYNKFGYFAEEGSEIICRQYHWLIKVDDFSDVLIEEEDEVYLDLNNCPAVVATFPLTSQTCYGNSVCGIYAENNSVINAEYSILVDNAYAVQSWKNSNIDFSNSVALKDETIVDDYNGIMCMIDSFVSINRSLIFNMSFPCYAYQGSFIFAEKSMIRDCEYSYYADNSTIIANNSFTFNIENHGIVGINASNIYCPYFITFNLPYDDFENYGSLPVDERGLEGWGVFIDKGSRINMENSHIFGCELGGVAILNGSFCSGDSSKIYFNGGDSGYTCYINFSSDALFRNSSIYGNYVGNHCFLVYKNSYLSVMNSVIEGATENEKAGVFAYENSVVEAEFTTIKNCDIGFEASILSYIFAASSSCDEDNGTVRIPYSPDGIMTAGNHTSYINR